MPALPKTLEKAKATDAENAELVRMLGIAYYLSGNKEQARANLEKALQANVKDSNT